MRSALFGLSAVCAASRSRGEPTTLGVAGSEERSPSEALWQAVGTAVEVGFSRGWIGGNACSVSLRPAEREGQTEPIKSDRSVWP